MQSVRSVAEDIVAREGGYVNDPDDPGGPTKFGVTIHTMRALGLDVDRDGDVDTDDVRALGRDTAIDIFVEHYFQRPGIGRLPHALQPSVFDMYVNSGSNAVRILQRLLRDMGLDIAVDGVIGPQINGLNRLPRPMLALGTLGLFIFAMVDPEAFGARMVGLDAVPEPLWWLLGAIVSFYFGARELHYFRDTDRYPGATALRAPWRRGPRQAPASDPIAGNPALSAWRSQASQD